MTRSSSARGRASATTEAERTTFPGLPSWRTNRPGSPGGPSIRPMVAKIAWTVSVSMSWFLTENGSIDGGMIHTLSPLSHDGA